MYKIERKASGFLLTFSGHIDAKEMQNWHDESKLTLSTEKSTSFPVIIDMRNLEPLPQEAFKLMVEGQKQYKLAGMKRSAVIVNNAATVGQFKALALQSGIYATERYFDGREADATANAISWARDGVDPDQ